MSIKVEGLKVLCDGECGVKRAGYCAHTCSTPTNGRLVNGVVAVEMPEGWTQGEGRVFGPMCSERQAMGKVLRASVPDHGDDPPIIQKAREGQVEVMREVIKEDLEGESDLEEKVASLREIVGRDNDPDFSGSFTGAHRDTVEVRVRSEDVEIRWPYTEGSMMSITIRHADLELVNPPPFIDASLVSWINGCLKTMKGDRLQKAAPAMN